MKKLILIMLLYSIPCESFAECAKVEYATMKDMSENDIINQHCKYKNEAMKYLEDSFKFDKENNQRLAGLCLKESSQVERIFRRQFYKELNYSSCLKSQ